MKNKKNESFSEWYHELANEILIDQRYPLQGFPVYRPWGYFIFSKYIRILEDLLDETGHQKCNFPLLIPERLLATEKDHIAGFHDSVFWVTHGGLSEMSEKAALRPTSETAMYTMLKLWIGSWRDLPFKIYQSCNVYRYETKHTRPLIRDREILWNEAHTSHASMEEAKEQIKIGVEIYRRVFERLALPVVFMNVVEGVFAGAEAAVEPYTVYPDGRALEMGSVNNLGQKFSRAFDIRFKTENGNEDYVYQTCYGLSERLLSAVIAVHGDDKGAVFTPEIAPVQIVIVPIVYEKSKKEIIEKSRELCERIAKTRSCRVRLDDREGITPGAKFYEWEMKGVPVRIEIGEKELKEGKLTIVRRDIGDRKTVENKGFEEKIPSLFAEIHSNLKRKAEEYHKSKIKDAKDDKEVRKTLDNKCMVRVIWCGELDCASELEKKMDAPFIGTDYDSTPESGVCTHCGREGKYYGYVAKMY
ncbi:MAG: proline--tRNA ligase [Candidatus Micrarchaeia archaeon]